MQESETPAGDRTPPPRSGVKKIPVQARAVETRAALLARVEEIVATEGAEAVTTTSLANRAGVSVGSLYRYFADRDALLLAAYDATVERIASACAKQLASLSRNMPVEDAARRLLEVYLMTAEAIPAHTGLLKAMRSIRTMDDEQDVSNVTVIGNLIAPFLQKFSPGARPDPARLHFMNVLIANLVDLYLVTPGTPSARARMRKEIEVHMLLALERTIRQNPLTGRERVSRPDDGRQ